MNKEIEQIKETIKDFLSTIKNLNEKIEKLRLICDHKWGQDEYKWSRLQQTCLECEKTRWREAPYGQGVVSFTGMSSSFYMPIKHTDGWYY